METYSGECNVGRKVSFTIFSNLMVLKVGNSVRGSRDRLCSRLQINVAIDKAFSRGCLKQFGRKGFRNVFDNCQSQSYSSERGLDITKERIAMYFLFP